MEPTELTRATARRLEPHAAERLARTDGDLANRAAPSSRRTGWATPPVRPRASTRTSGAGTRRASRSATPAGTTTAPQAGAARALRRAVGRRPPAAHPLRPDGPATSRGRSSGRPQLSPGAPGPADVRNRPAAGARDGRAEGLPSRAGRRRRRCAFSARCSPKLAAWHDYLYRERTRADDGLVEIWHPWESGMDNSPLWDDALARIYLTDGNARSTSASTSSSWTRPASDRTATTTATRTS